MTIGRSSHGERGNDESRYGSRHRGHRPRAAHVQEVADAEEAGGAVVRLPLSRDAPRLFFQPCAKFHSRSHDGMSREVNIVDVIDEHNIKVDVDLTEWLGSIDENGNVITETIISTLTPEEYEELEETDGYVLGESNTYTKTTTTNVGNNIVVKGEVVDDFKILNKDYLWTIATSALQEVDRQLQAEKNKVASLEARISALENN